MAKRFPLLSDEIQGVLDLGEQNHHGTSARLVEAAMHQTGEDAHREDFKEATPQHHRNAWMIAGSVMATVTLLAFVLSPQPP